MNLDRKLDNADWVKALRWDGDDGLMRAQIRGMTRRQVRALMRLPMWAKVPLAVRKEAEQRLGTTHR